MTTKMKMGLAVAAAIVMISPALVDAAITRQLENGMSGPDVTELQTFLAADSALYPEGLITGYYGALTEAAVARFQTANDIPAVGRVGPLTLPVLNARMAGGASSGGGAPILGNLFVNPSRTNATVNWNTDKAASGIVYYSSTPLTVTEFPHSVVVNGGMSALTDTSFRSAQSVALQNLQSNTTYYYMVQSIDQSGNVSVSWPATFRTTD